MPKPTSQSSHEMMHIAFFREVLRDIRRIMKNEYGVNRISVRPIKSEASRLSIPVKISGLDAKGEQAHYFGKILGSNDIISDRSMQFFKNLFLQMNAQDPIFGFTDSAGDMALQQFESLDAIYKTGVPTAKPFGYHLINGEIWLLVTAYLESRPELDRREVTGDQIDALFSYLRRLHHAGIFHGDIKADNVMLGDKIYVLDAGVFRADTEASRKQAYDLACLICSFLDVRPIEDTVVKARKYYSRKEMRGAAEYIDLIQQRQDFHIGNPLKNELKQLLSS